MAKARSDNREKAYKMLHDSGSTMKFKDIAAEIGVTDTLVRKWKSQDNWAGKSIVTLPNSIVT